MKIEYFNSILENNNLHNWLSDYIYNRVGVENIIKFENNEFTILFFDNSHEFTINFKSNGRASFFDSEVNLFFEINKNTSLLFGFSELLPKNGLICYGVSNFEWFIHTPNLNYISLNYDFVSYAIWTLNRIEESEIISSDKHNRFELSNSHLHVNYMYLRPIVDEWVLFIRNLLKSNGFIINKSIFNFSLSHDIDIISRYKEVPFVHKLLKIFKDLFFSFNTLFSYFKDSNSFVQLENSNNIEDLMILSESINSKSKFYFIAGNSSFRYDYRYYITSEFILRLINKIVTKGHEVGIHYSYNSSAKKLIKKEWSFFFNLCKELGFKIEGGRMHYLRIKFPDTLLQLAQTGQIYDNTLTFHESGGFRCGTCFPYKPYNFVTNEKIDIEVRPLILMDDSLLNYMNTFDIEKTFDYVKNLIDSCWEVNGTFSLLWHNSNLNNEFNSLLYQRILLYLKQVSKK
jgi:hypothetical protein